MPAEKQFTIGEAEVVQILLSSNTSNGQFSVILETCPPQAGPPPHVHKLEDEFFIPLEGEFEVFDGERWSPMPKSGVYGVRNQLHTWRNAGHTFGKLLIVASGNSFDKFLEKFAAMRLPEQMQEMIEMSATHGISYVMPPAPEATAEHAQEPVLA